MTHSRIAATALATISLFGVGVGAVAVPLAVPAAIPTAAAQPSDYSNLPIDPNDLTDDDLVFTVLSSVPNPNGNPGIETVYTHRDGTRIITNTIHVLADPAAATGALDAARGGLNNLVPGAIPQPVPVGNGGTVVAGLSPDRSKSVTVLVFTEGKAFAQIEFDGPPNDPVSMQQVIDVGQVQVVDLRDGLV